jgi:hypothetical protein
MGMEVALKSFIIVIGTRDLWFIALDMNGENLNSIMVLPSPHFCWSTVVCLISLCVEEIPI